MRTFIGSFPFNCTVLGIQSTLGSLGIKRCHWMEVDGVNKNQHNLLTKPSHFPASDSFKASHRLWHFSWQLEMFVYVSSAQKRQRKETTVALHLHWRPPLVRHLIFSPLIWLCGTLDSSLDLLSENFFHPSLRTLTNYVCEKSDRYCLKSHNTMHKCDIRYKIYAVHCKSDSPYFIAKWPRSLPILTNMVLKSCEISY